MTFWPSFLKQTKDFCIAIASYSRRIVVGHQYGRIFFVLGYQHHRVAMTLLTHENTQRCFIFCPFSSIETFSINKKWFEFVFFLL